MKKLATRISILLIILQTLFIFGCKPNSSKTNFIIWTDRPEFVSYTELFNSMQEKTKAIVVYKKNLANSFPIAKDEEKPDLVVGSWLKNERIRKNFRALDSLLSKDKVDSSAIYSSLFKYGQHSGKQFLLPVSFNLPLVIFSTKNENLIENKYTLTLDELRDLGALFNSKNSSGVFTKMGFAPSWDKEFVYEVSKKYGQCFKEKGTSFTWDKNKLDSAVDYVKNWTLTKNDSTTSEQDFQFKYLYTPKYRQIAAERTLFAYTTSEDFFNIASEQLGDIDFRWLEINKTLPATDDIVSMAIYKNAKNSRRAEDFILWFFKAENQKLMLERAKKMDLDTVTFGISSGFSSIQSVTEYIFPSYYRNLLGNLPSAQKISAPQSFPARWDSLKERVIYPYFTNATNTDTTKRNPTMESLLNAWSKQFD